MKYKGDHGPGEQHIMLGLSLKAASVMIEDSWFWRTKLLSQLFCSLLIKIQLLANINSIAITFRLQNTS